KNGETFEGRSFHNGRFLMALRAQATAAGAQLIEGTATSLEEEKNSGRICGFKYRTAEGTKTCTAALTVICDGLFSNFRSTLLHNTFQTRSKFLGLVLKNPVYPSKNEGNVILANPTPILLYPISSNEARML